MKGRIAALDGVRALAILMVMFHHAIGFIHTPTAGAAERLLDWLGTEGWVGVDLFFVLSGYLITGILLRTKGQPRYFRNFIMRRALRIFPLYYLFLLVFFVILPRLFPGDPELAKLPGVQAWYWTYLPNVKIFLTGDWDARYVEHAWSLSIEEQFYLVWPLVVALCSRRVLLAVCGLGTLASIALRVYLVSRGAERAAAMVLTPAHFDGLMLGAILATIEPALRADWARGRRWLLIAGAVGLLSLASLAAAPMGYELKHYALSVASWSLVFAAFVGLVVTASDGSPMVRALSVRPLRAIGTYSYGLYLLHQPVMRVLGDRLDALPGPASWKWATMGVVGGLLSFALAALVYELFEARFLALKKWFEPAVARPEIASAPAPPRPQPSGPVAPAS